MTTRQTSDHESAGSFLLGRSFVDFLKILKGFHSLVAKTWSMHIYGIDKNWTLNPFSYKKLPRLVFHLFALLSEILGFLLLGAVVLAVGIVCLLVFFFLGLVCLTVLSFIEFLHIVWNRLFFVCPDCHASVTNPIYICPGCGRYHKSLRPGLKGIFWRKCACGKCLPTIHFFRKKLSAICPTQKCGHSFTAKETVPVRISIAGQVNSGKSTVLAAIFRDFFQKTIGDRGWRMLFPEEYFNDSASPSPVRFRQIFQETFGCAGFTHISVRRFLTRNVILTRLKFWQKN